MKCLDKFPTFYLKLSILVWVEIILKVNKRAVKRLKLLYHIIYS